MISTLTLAFFQGIGGPEMVLIFLLVLILFGGQRLPDFARGLGKSIREFKKAASGVEEEIKRAMEDPPPRPKPTASLPAGTEPHKSPDYEYDYDQQDPHADYSHPDYPYDHPDSDHPATSETPSLATEAEAGPAATEPSPTESPSPPSSSAQADASPPAPPPDDVSPPPPPPPRV